MQASVTTKVIAHTPRGRLDLLVGYSHDDAVELVPCDDLAAQPAVRVPREHAVEHAVFLSVGARELVDPGRVHVNVARRARARSAAFGDDARDVVVDGGLHEGAAGGDVDDTLFAVGLDVGHLRHGGKQSRCGPCEICLCT